MNGDKCVCCGDYVPEGRQVCNKCEIPSIKDSGERTVYESGAVRDIQKGKGRCDLLPLDALIVIVPYKEINEISLYMKDGCITHLAEALAHFTHAYYQDINTMFLEVSKHFEEGAIKYGENNWQKGIPVHSYIDSAIRHYLKFRRGDNDEPHDKAFVWNILCCIWTCINKPEYIDINFLKSEVLN